MSFAPSFLQTNSSGFNPTTGAGLPHWDDAGWVYTPSLLNLVAPGAASSSLFSFSIYDIGVPKLVSRVVASYFTNHAVTGIRLWGSLDGVSYQPLCNLPDSAGAGVVTAADVSFTATCCRYIILPVVDLNQNAGAFNYLVYSGGAPAYPPSATVPTAPNTPSGTLTATPNVASGLQPAVTLTWSTTNATSASINNGIGPVALSGSLVVNVAADTTFTLTYGTCSVTGTVSASVTFLQIPAITATPALPGNVPTVDLSAQ